MTFVVTATAAAADPTPPALELAANARLAAHDGNCAAVERLAVQIRNLDQLYFNTTFVIDPALGQCAPAARAVWEHALVTIPRAPETPPRAPDGAPKSAWAAFALSLGATGAGLGILAAAEHRPSDSGLHTPLVALGLAGLAIGPTTGHIYAGHGWNGGLAVRIPALAIAAFGFYTAGGCNVRCSSDNVAGYGAGGFLFGGFAYFSATLYEIVSARDAAHDYNREHGWEPTLAVVPVRGTRDTVPALALGGRF